MKKRTPDEVPPRGAGTAGAARFESTLAAYETGKTSFDALLATEADYLRLRLQYYEFVARQRTGHRHVRALAERGHRMEQENSSWR